MMPNRSSGEGVWQKDQVRHVGEYRELEDQMLNFSTAGYLGSRSPDRVDALVWALTDLMVVPMPSWGIFEVTRQRAMEARPVPPPPPEPYYAPGWSHEFARLLLGKADMRAD